MKSINLILFVIAMCNILAINENYVTDPDLLHPDYKQVIQGNLLDTKVLSVYEDNTHREIEQPEIPLDVIIESDKKLYERYEPINIRVEIKYSGKDSIRIIKMFDPYELYFIERFCRNLYEKRMIVDTPASALGSSDPTSKHLIYLTSGESYIIEYQINKTRGSYLGKEMFSFVEKYRISLDWGQRIMVYKESGESNYTDQFIWQSNEIEFEVVE